MRVVRDIADEACGDKSCDLCFVDAPAEPKIAERGLSGDVLRPGTNWAGAGWVSPTRKKVYLAGPMTGLPGFNYAAFNKVAARWRREGWEVLNPAEHFGGALGLDRAVYMRAGIEGVLKADAVAAIWGWEASKGARLEVAIAMELGLPVYGEHAFPEGARIDGIEESVARLPKSLLSQVIDGTAPVPTQTKVADKSILLEAQNLVHGDRQRAYGHPRTNFQRIADLWSARLKEKLSEPITVEEVGMLMILIKVARDQQTPKRDNLTDIAGYAETISMCREEPTTPPAIAFRAVEFEHLGLA